MRPKSYKTLFAICLFATSINMLAQQTVTDIDGNVYQTVTIGTQKWMKENLKTIHFNNGDSIATTYPASLDYSNESTPKYQWAYNGNDSLANVFGRLYTWYAVTDNRKVCPTGWHVPTDAEWITLSNYLGGDIAAQGQLKEAGTAHWESPNADATNESSFTALPGGNRWATGIFVGLGTFSHWWTATEDASDKTAAWRRILVNDDPAENFRGTADKKIGWAVRCIEDPIPDSVKYLGQTPPSESAIKFAPDNISLPNRMECKIIFSPDGHECYFSVIENNICKTYYKKLVNNIWTEQVLAPFSVNKSIYINCFSADGNKLYFDDDNDIWVVERTAGGWGEPQLLPSPVNSSSYDRGYTVTEDSVVFIYSNRPGSVVGTWGDNWDIWRISPLSNQAENPGSGINSSVWQDSPCVAPDGSYLVYSQSSSDYESSFLLICFNKGNGEWTKPVKMNINGVDLNIPYQNGPTLSPDGKYLFYQRHNQYVMDIYWVSTNIVEGLKRYAFAPRLSRQIAAMNVQIDSAINYVIPQNTFTCEYGTESLIYSATLKNGYDLPSWLHFDPETRTLSGTATQAGIDTIKIVAMNKDTVSASCTFKITVNSITGISQINEDQIIVFPNPTKGEIRINTSDKIIKSCYYQLTDLSGKIVTGGTLQSQTINITDLTKGLYLLSLYSSEGILNKKIVIE